MKFNAENYQELLRRAIGHRTQKDFAVIAGLSPFNLNRMLNDEPSSLSVPRKSTLKKIAEAAEGRVTEAQLLYACGYAMQQALSISDDLTPQEKNLEIASRYKSGLEKVAGSAMKYSSVNEFLDTVSLTDGIQYMHSRVAEASEFEGVGHWNAERMAHCSTYWRYDGYDARLDFTVLFCETTKQGVIISDVVFDLDSLVQWHHDKVGSFLFAMAEKGDVNYADFPMAFSCKKHVPGEAEKRLLQAIFGENDD